MSVGKNRWRGSCSLFKSQKQLLVSVFGLWVSMTSFSQYHQPKKNTLTSQVTALWLMHLSTSRWMLSSSIVFPLTSVSTLLRTSGCTCILFFFFLLELMHSKHGLLKNAHPIFYACLMQATTKNLHCWQRAINSWNAVTHKACRNTAYRRKKVLCSNNFRAL